MNPPEAAPESLITNEVNEMQNQNSQEKSTHTPDNSEAKITENHEVAQVSLNQEPEVIS